MNQNKFNEKIRSQVQSYLTPKNNTVPPIPPVRRDQPTDLQRRPPQIPRTPQKVQQNIPVNNPMNVPKELTKTVKPSNFESQSLIINNQKIVNGGTQSMTLKIPLKKKQLNLQTLDNGELRFKFQIKNELTKIQISENILTIICKKMSEYKNLNKEKKTPNWVLTNIIPNPNTLRDKQNVLIASFSKQLLQKALPNKISILDRLLEQQFVVYKDGKILQSTKQTVNQFVKQQDGTKVQVLKMKIQEPEQGQQKIQFKVLSKDDMKEIEKFKRNLTQMKQEDKLMILTEAFKIKKQFDDGSEKKLKCPIFTCAKIYQTVQQLKSHIKKHPELSKNGIQINQMGGFEYSQKALDFALIMGKIYPNEMKNIIKMMKQRTAYDT